MPFAIRPLLTAAASACPGRHIRLTALAGAACLLMACSERGPAPALAGAAPTVATAAPFVSEDHSVPDAAATFGAAQAANPANVANAAGKAAGTGASGPAAPVPSGARTNTAMTPAQEKGAMPMAGQNNDHSAPLPAPRPASAAAPR